MATWLVYSSRSHHIDRYAVIPRRKQQMTEHHSRRAARAKPESLHVTNLEICLGDIELLVHENLKEIYLNSVSFETFQIREVFIRRLLVLDTVTTFCVQHLTKFVLPHISRGLLKGSFPYLTNLWLEYITLEQQTMEMITVALQHTRPLGFLELFKLKGDPNYASIFSVVPKIRRLTLFTVHVLSQRELFFLVKALNTSVKELQRLTVMHNSQWSFTKSPN